MYLCNDSLKTEHTGIAPAQPLDYICPTLRRPGVRADSATISGGHHVTHASPFIARAAIIQGRKGAPSPGAHRESSTASRVVYPPVAAIQRREREEGSETAGAKVRRFVSFLYFRCVRFANLVVGIKCDGFQR